MMTLASSWCTAGRGWIGSVPQLSAAGSESTSGTGLIMLSLRKLSEKAKLLKLVLMSC